MPAYKDKAKGTWYASFYYEDWTGKKVKKMKRGFPTKREALAWELTRLCPECTVYGVDLGADFVPHGNQKLLYKHCGLDEASIARFVKEVLSHEN